MTHVGAVAKVLLAHASPLTVQIIMAESGVPMRSTYVVLHGLEVSGAIWREGHQGKRRYGVKDQAILRERVASAHRGGYHPPEDRHMKADFGPLLSCLTP